MVDSEHLRRYLEKTVRNLSTGQMSCAPLTVGTHQRDRNTEIELNTGEVQVSPHTSDLRVGCNGGTELTRGIVRARKVVRRTDV